MSYGLRYFDRRETGGPFWLLSVDGRCVSAPSLRLLVVRVLRRRWR